MLTIELAAKLNGREVGKEIPREFQTNLGYSEIKTSGFVIIFGYSDDGIVFFGAINEHLDCYRGGIFYFDKNGLIKNTCNDNYCPCYQKLLSQESVKTIEAKWNNDGYSWTYETKIPHEIFEIKEEDEKYCRGIVFSIADLKRKI